MFICGPGMKDVPVCRVCGHIADKLCDYPVGKGKTCDSKLCIEHAVNIKGDLDYCPEHAQEYCRSPFAGNHEAANKNFPLPRKR